MIRRCLFGAAILLCGFATLASGSAAPRGRPAPLPSQIAGVEPPAGAVLRQASVLVSGDCGGAVSVAVSGVSARVYGGRFAAENVPLSEGSNALIIEAQDAAGTARTWTHILIRDTAAPRLAISAPGAGVVTGKPTLTVVGKSLDEHLASVEVQGASAELKGSSFQRAGISLVEGPNLLRVVARDEAGNLAAARLEVVRDSTAPLLRITSPAEGSRSAAVSVDVEGTVSDAHLQSVRVNGIAATVAGGRFRAPGVRLAQGSNALTVVAADRAGNISRHAVAVVRDSAALTIRVDSPSPGSRSLAESVAVSGSVVESPDAAVSVNGVEAKASKGRFTTDGVPLREGANTLTVRAAGGSRHGLLNSIVFQDTVAPRILSFSPPAETAGIPGTAVVRVLFSESLAPETVSSSTVVLVAEGSGDPVPSTVYLIEHEISVVPATPLAEQTAYRVAISAELADLAGNRIEKPGASRFVTGSSRGVATPILDPIPASLCASSLDLTGRADPGARVRVLGGAAIVTALADSAGRFFAAVPLHGNALNTLRAASLDARERPSPPASAVLRADCAPPSVESARLEGEDLVVRFSESIDPAMFAREGAVTLTGPKGETQVPLRLDPDGITARAAGLAGLSGHVWTVHVRTGVADAAGNRLVAPFAASLLTTGDSGLIGEVFDDRTGRPLPGSVITVLAIDGTPPSPPAPTTTTDSDGQFSLVVPAGNVVFSANRDGYSSVMRTEIAPSAGAVVAFDARLTPFTSVTARSDGGADIADGNLLLALPTGSLSPGAPIRAAALSPQGIPILVPLGWTAAAALSLDTAGASLALPASASWKNGLGLPAGTALLFARYDAATRRYLTAGPASLSPDDSRILAAVPSSGMFVVFAADPGANAPAQPATGQPLTGVAAPPSDPILSASVTTDPSAVLPTETAEITATLAVSAPVPSGSPVEVLIAETLTLVNGQQIQSPSFLADLTVVRDGAGRAIVPFRIHPSATAAQVALSVGYENLTVRRYSYNLRLGDLVGASGGTVTGPGKFSLFVPPNALSQTVPVKLTPVASAADLVVPVPDGYQFVAALQITLGGKNLTAAATLNWASADDPTRGGLVWAEVTEWNGLLRTRFVAQARYLNAQVVTVPIDPAVLPAPGVMRGGLYVLLSANSPLAYVKGRVLDVPGTTLASAVVTQDGTALVAVTDSAGTFALPAPASGATIRSIRVDTGNTGQAAVPAQAAGAVASADIRLAVAAPYVLSVLPATASPLPLDLPVVFTLSEPLNAATVTNTSVSAAAGVAVISGTVRLSNSGTQVTFIPTGSWPGKATVRLTLSSSVTDLQGYRLVDRTTQATGDFVATYTTVDPTPPSDINPLLISMNFPSGTPPAVSIIGAPGAACGSCSVIAVNETTGVSSATTAGVDGSFSLTVPATATDRVSLTMQRPGGGGDIRVDPGPFKVDGGRTAYVGTRAADYLTGDGIRVTLDDGAFAGPVTLKVKPIPQSALPAPAPPLATFIAGIEIDPGDAVAGRPVDLAVAAPPGVTGGQFLVARAVEILGETRWMVVDTARYENGAITTRPEVGTQPQSSVVKLAVAARAAGLALAQDCPQLVQPGGSKTILDRVIRKSNLIILGVQQQLAFLASSVISPNVAASVVFSGQHSYLADLLPFVWIARESKQQCYFALPVPVGLDGVPFTLLGRDATTGLTIFQAARPAITDATNVTVLPGDVLAGNLPAPRLVSGSPFTVTTFVPMPTASASDEISLLQKVRYSFGVSTGQVVLNGDPGAVEACARDSSGACTGFVELSLVNNSRAVAAAVATAHADGSFGPLSIAATSGDDLTLIAGTDSLAPNANVRLVFTQMLAPSALKADLALKDGATALAFDLIPDSSGTGGSRGFTVAPSLAFARGHSISLTLAGGSGNRVPSPLTIRMSSPSSNLIGGRDVRNVNALYLKGGLLLEVTGDGGNVGDTTGASPKLNLYDASDPASLTLCASLSLEDYARGVTMDGHDRVLVAMGGGGSNGRVQAIRLTAPGVDRTVPCAGRSLAGEGDLVAGKKLDRAWTEVTIRAGAGDLGVLPVGFPRRLEALARETRDVIVLDQPATLPTFVTELRRTDLLPAGGDGKQDPDSTLTVVGRIPANPGDSFPSPLNQPATVTNLTTSDSWTAYADAAGNFTIAARASSGDRLEFRVNAADLAIVGTEGFGIQGVEINKTVHFDSDDCRPGSGGSNDPCEGSRRLLFSFGRVADLTPLCKSRDGASVCVDAVRTLEGLNDLTLLPAASADAPGDPPDPTAVALVNRFGLATFSLSGSGGQVQINQLGPGLPLATFGSPSEYPLMFAVQAARGFPVKPAAQRSYCSRDIWTGYRPTLAFVATARGIFVVDVTNARASNPSDPPDGSPYPSPRIVGFFDIAAGANTLALDSKRGILYVGLSAPSAGVAAYDMTDPCTMGLDNHTAVESDPRRIAFIATPAQNVNVPFALDADTGLIFGASDSDTSGTGRAFALSLFTPPIRFVADTNRDGFWEEVAEVIPLGVPNPRKPAAPYAPDVVRILANIWGHAGSEIVVELSSTSATGVLVTDPPTEFPRTRIDVTLTRQSDDPADPGYNRYLSPPFVLVADPRSRRKYSLIAAEDASKPEGQNNPNACQNCKPDAGYGTELAALATAPPASNDGRDRAHPIKQAFELWTSEKLVARLAESAAAEAALKSKATYLNGIDLQRVVAEAKATRADWTPSLRQTPRLNPSVVADEVDSGVALTSGEASLTARDLSIAGRGLDFALDRFYDSQGVSFGPLGRSWDSPLFARLRDLPSGDVDFYDGTGRRETFQYDSDRRAFVAPAGRFAELYRLPDLTFFLREHDNTKLRFDPTGRLVSISDAVRTVESETDGDGNRLRFSYDAAGKLTQVTDALDHVVRLDYYPSDAVKGQSGAYPGLLKTVMDHTSREVLYLYDAKGRLKEVRLPEIASNGSTPLTGAARRRVSYTYLDGPDPAVDFKQALLEGDNLLTASNARAQELLHFDYADSFSLGAAEAVTTRQIAGVPEVFSYTPITGTAVFTSRRGHQTTVDHDVDGHPTRAAFSGNSTADVNSADPLSSIAVVAGVVPAGPFETRFSYSGTDGLTQSATLPSGRSVSHSYPIVAADAPDRRRRANVTAVTVAGTGLSLRDEFAYQDLANQVVAHKDPTGAITTFDRDPQKGYVTKVELPTTVGTDAQNPPVPGLNIDRDAATGQPRAEADQAGAAQGYAYFASGDPAYGYVKSVTEQASSFGTTYEPVAPSTTAFARDARGNVLSVTDPRGTVTNFEVNEANWVVKATVPSANVTRTYEYDADANLVRETYLQSPLGTATKTYTYDALGRRRSVTVGGLAAASATTTYQYSSSGELIGVTHPEGEIDLSVYDGRGLLVGQQRRHADGTATAMRTFKRDEDGRVIEDFDGVNSRTTMTYEAVGRVSRVTTPRGSEVRVEYDGADRPVHVTVVDPGSGDVLKERRIDYAGNGQVARRRDILRKTPSDPSPTEVVTQYAYDAGERPIRVIDPLNRTSLRAYDDHGRPSRVEDPAHNVVTAEYDLAGNAIRRHVFEIKPDGTSEAERIEETTYDALNRVTSRKDPLGHATTAGYDEEGNLLSVVDALTHKTTYGYDERGRRVSMVDALGNKAGGSPAAHRTQWIWDRSGKQISLIDANNHTTSYAYDSLGRLTSITYPDTKKELKTWNSDGTVATATDPNGSVAAFTHGPDDQPERVDYTKGTGIIGLTQETYAYDKLGRLLSASANAGVGGSSHATARSYDSFDRMISETQDGRVLTHSFDTIGNPIDVTYPTSGRKFVRTFDALNRASRLEEDVSGTKRLVRGFDYFGFNRLAKVTAPGNVETTYAYDASRRLTSLTATNTTTSTDFLKYALGWADDDVPVYGQRLHEASKGDVFQHDEDHRLTLATLSQANPTGPPDLAAAYRQELTLGTVHERTLDKLTLSGTTTSNTVTPNLRYGYTAYGAQTRAYDPSGNLASRGSDVFKYDARSRLVQADLAGGMKLEFGYDALGRRVEKKKTVSGTSTTTTWVYDGWNAVQELRAATLHRETVYGAGLDDALEYRIAGTPSHDYEIFRDATGSTASVVSDTGTTQLFKYLPFGTPSLLSGTTGTYNFDLSTTTTTSLWQGLELDPDLGWYYARNRWYDPDTGGFTASDPLGYPDSANTYVWGVSAPWASDPMGLQEEPPVEYVDGMEQALQARAREAQALRWAARGAGVAKEASEIALDPVYGVERGVKDVKEGRYGAAALEAAPYALPAAGGVIRRVGGVLRRVPSIAKGERLLGGGTLRQAVRGEGRAVAASAGRRFTYNMVENPGPLAKFVRPVQPASGFAGGRYNAIRLEEDLVVYRGGAAGGGRNALGEWFTRTPPVSRAQARIDQAVRPQWIDPKTGYMIGTSPIESAYAVRIPKGTMIYEGPTSSQGGVYIAGTEELQIFISEPWNTRGVRPVWERTLP